MQTHEIFYPPDNKKEYNDQNIIEAITFISDHIHQFSSICIQYAWYAENCTFYPWIKLSSISSSDFGIIILPDYLPEEEKEARKEILRLKRMIKKAFPDILVTSNLRLSVKTWNEMVRKRKKKRKMNKEQDVRLSAVYKLVFSPACEAKTGIFYPQTIFCLPWIFRSTLC